MAYGPNHFLITPRRAMHCYIGGASTQRRWDLSHAQVSCSIWLPARVGHPSLTCHFPDLKVGTKLMHIPLRYCHLMHMILASFSPFRHWWAPVMTLPSFAMMIAYSYAPPRTAWTVSGIPKHHPPTRWCISLSRAPLPNGYNSPTNRVDIVRFSTW